ncbi:ArsO family NAD(P)H-dependent flavin-containing monooxygenase [Ornithinimicrobium cryptoxanthini]|uniref:ArsO family NAD(P)H-dependent flavin-containing monooxygenase n=1 Tax=Ornithinimicrobium cryptoxanthini TaxID=2934161 RepID=A0ABY4YJ48_9MICO|nr:ArsO family NAD(P)H-dependent flavin-containing monooxygenase [Ornithinimicrobium cryptoxanthini]USQ76652.1 ArsO family NAD(P)H-dependent flavin-containing monooxygenase [Ornithinimicrobium cryptoxanthini]
MTTRTLASQALVVGGGQAGLATAYYLRRAGVEYVVLDDQDRPGGAWRHTWDSLRLFSPATFSSLPGWQMPPTGGYPDAEHVVDYLTQYEQRYTMPVRRGVKVIAVEAPGAGYRVTTSEGTWHADAVFNATGTWSRPFIPTHPGAATFSGEQLHSAQYRSWEPYTGRRVVVVGGGNSGAQIAADLSGQAEVTWCTTEPPRFLPDEVDGRELFRVASLRARGLGEGIGGLGDIVAVPPVRTARDAGLLHRVPMFERFTAEGVAWSDGTTRPVDAVIWCTGFRPQLSHLTPLGLHRDDGLPSTDGPVAANRPTLGFVGYGDWCGLASATLIGVGQWARQAVQRALR